MDSVRPSNLNNYLSLEDTAKCLAVSVDTLLHWNEQNILKPTITPKGEICYYRKQIDQFIQIQKITRQLNSQNSDPKILAKENTPIVEIKTENPVVGLKSSTTNNNISTEYSTPPKNNRTTLVSYFGIAGIFLLLIISISGVLLFQQRKLDSLIYQNQIAYKKDADIFTSDNKTLNETPNLSDPSKDLNEDHSISESDNRFTSLHTVFEPKEESSSKSQSYQDQIALVKSILGSDSGAKSESVTREYSQTSNFSTSSSCPTCSNNSDAENTVFDTQGNIKVSKDNPDESKLLATAVGVGAVTQNQSLSKQNPSSMILVTVITLGMFSIYAVYSSRKHLHLIHYPVKADGANSSLISVPEIEIKKILELDQKTDGTVVIYFANQEYKVSKPELDSESDKFIERLMEVIPVGVKEIEYDSLQDDSFVLSSPLSKIVTRLGFVGIKRDLFFPRTSKSRVLFRKYITEDDLLSMNLTTEQITSNFINDY